MNTIYGPYLAKDGRLRLFIHCPSGLGITISYPKYIMEVHLGRSLNDNEIVHHKDRNPSNNELSNLEILTQSEHARLHAIKNEMEIFICRHCNKPFEVKGLKLSKIKQNKKQGKRGPFCSKSCAGKGESF